LRARGSAASTAAGNPWCIGLTAGGGVIAAGSSSGSVDDSINGTDFSTSDATVYETYVDSGTGKTAIRFLQAGAYLIVVKVTASMDTLGFTAAQLTTVSRIAVLPSVAEYFGGGSYDRRILLPEIVSSAPAMGASTRSAAGNKPAIWRGMGLALLDLPGTGDNLGDEYGVAANAQALTDYVTGSTFPGNLTAGGNVFIVRLGDSLPTASLPWW
jgi:hypothetical protein